MGEGGGGKNSLTILTIVRIVPKGLFLFVHRILCSPASFVM